MSEILKKAKRHAIDHYGNLVYPMEPRYDPTFKRYTVNLGVHMPRLIINDATNARIINTLTLEKLCQITYNKNGNLQTQPTKHECLQALLNPAVVIANWLYHHNTLTEDNLEDLTRTEKYWDYIDLLKSLQVIAYGDDKFGLGKIGQGIREKSKTKDEFIRNTLSLILSERYSYIEEVMQIRVLSALIHTNTAYYKFCIEANQNIEKRPESIHREYEKIYGRRSYVEFFNSLMELSRGNVIHYLEPYVTANEQILENINKIEVPQNVSPP